MRRAPFRRHLLSSIDITSPGFLGWTFPALCFEEVNHRPNVFDLGFDQASQEDLKVFQFSVVRVREPRYYFDAVGVLPLEVFSDIVDDDGLLKVSAQQSQVLNIDAIIILSVLAVESMLDVGLGRVEDV